MNLDSNPSNPKVPKNLYSRIIERLPKQIPTDLVQKILETFSTRIILIVFSLMTSVIIARSLGPEGRGLYALALTIGVLGIQLTNLGLHSSNTFYVARDSNLLAPLMGNSLLISFSLGGLCAVIIGLVFYAFPEMAPVQGPILYMALAWIPFGLAYLLNQNLILGIQETRSFNKLEIYNKAISIVLIIAVILSGWVTPSSLFATSFLSLLICFIWTFHILGKHLSRPIKLSKSIFGKYLPYGIKAYFSSLVGFLLLRMDLLMVDQILGKREAGLYDIAIGMSEMIYLFPLVVSTLLFPKLSAITDLREKWDLSKNVGKAMLAIMAVICCVGAVLAQPLISILYGNPFLACVPAFIFLIACKFTMAVHSIFNNFIASIHVPWAIIPISILILGINIFLNLFWIKTYGIAGAAFSSIVCFVLLIMVNFYYTRKYLSADFSLPK
jgi:O-antigen/teichoic acid export membrane protein